MAYITYTPECLARIRRVADECDYVVKEIAQRMHVCDSLVSEWSSRGWVTGDVKVKPLQMRMRRRAEHIIATLNKHHGDKVKAAKELRMSVSGMESSLVRAGFKSKDVAKYLTPQTCVVCGNKFHIRDKRRLTCSQECREEQIRVNRLQRDRIRKGRDPHAPLYSQVIHERNRLALMETYGDVARAGHRIGVAREAIWRWIRQNNMHDWLQTLRMRKRDPEHIHMLLEENNWRIEVVEEKLGHTGGWLRRVLSEANRLDLVDNAPCLECGKMTPRRRTRQTVCSVECQTERTRRQQAAYYSRRKNKCINQSR